MTRLQQLGLRFLGERELGPVLVEIVDTAIDFAGSDFGTIQIFDPKTNRLRLAAHRGFEPWWVDFWTNVEEGQGTCGEALEIDGRVVVDDVETSPIFAGTPSLAIQLRAGVRAVQSTPLRSWSGKLIGVFSTHYKVPHRPSEETFALLDLLAFQAASIIERFQTEENEREVRRQVEHANEELVAFNHIVCHDLREPIRTAGALLELYLRRKDDQSFVESASQAVKRTLRLLEAIAGYSQAGRSEEPIAPVDTAELVREVRENLEVLIREQGGEIAWETLPPIRGRRGELAQLFQNLVMNGLKFHRPGTPPRVTVSARSQNGGWLFAVTDNGIGFAPAFAEKVFAPFARLDAGHDGTGMGLAICKKIVARHGGRIWAESKPGEGSTFWAYLPD